MGPLKIRWIEIEDAEADDVIATLVRGVPAGRDILIMSSDRDMYRLGSAGLLLVLVSGLVRPDADVVGLLLQFDPVSHGEAPGHLAR